MKRTFKVYIKIKDCDQVFMEGQKPGVIGVEDLEYNLNEEVFNKPEFVLSVIHKGEEFLKELVDVQIQEVKD